MPREEPQYRKKLNEKQIDLLKLLYRFRFATTDLIARSQGKKDSSQVYPRLKTLLEQEYVGRKYEPEYRLRGQHASYHLLAKGLRVLRHLPDGKFDPKVLHTIHRDKMATDQFIERNLAIFDAYCHLKAQYGERLEFFTKSDLADYDHFPQPLPDGYLRLKTGIGEVKQFFLDVHQEARPFFVATRRIKQYADYADSKKWQITETDLPDILAVCDTPALQKRLHMRMAKETHPELSFLLTTKEALTKIVHDTRIWRRASGQDSLASLESLY